MTTGFARLKSTDTVLDALRLFSTEMRLELPVVDGQERLLGVVSVSRLLRAASIEKGAAPSEGLFDLVTKDFFSVTPETPAEELVSYFSDESNAGRCVPVTDNHKRLLGVITPLEVTVRLCEYIQKSR
jgi:CBS-domain-containing membrane protein